MQEVLEISNKTGLFETGGGHGQKGVDFQRYWAVLRMIELEQTGAKDFLLLFESIQDIAEFDSATTPTSVKIYQIKKKERSEWTWTQLTKLPVLKPTIGTKKKKTIKVNKDKFGESPLGKLYLSVIAFQKLQSSGRFISNAGCDVELLGGGSLATSLPCDLTKLSTDHVKLLNTGLGMLTPEGGPPPDLTRLSIERTSLPANEFEKYVIGVMFIFLEMRSPRHAAQARALVDALVAQISPLGRKTDKCATLQDLIKERGISCAEFNDALGTLEMMPDRMALLENWLTRLVNEGMDLMTLTAIKVAASKNFRRQLFGGRTIRDNALEAAAQKWVTENPMTAQLLNYLETGVKALETDFTDYRKADLFSEIMLKGIELCEALT